MKRPLCRFCGEVLEETFADLGLTPLANGYLKPEAAGLAELFYPLHARVCGTCLLVQVSQVERPEVLFGEYAYFSSYSDLWLEHCRDYVATMAQRFALGPPSLVVEVASNDGYLLQFFRDKNVRVLGIEPAVNVAKVAKAKGIPTLTRFFGRKAAEELRDTGFAADLMIANNVLAHVPDLNDFVSGFKCLLKPEGALTVEFPSLQYLIDRNEFDTIYHEHFSYFCLLTAEHVFRAHGLDVFDVERLSTHGGSLRLYVGHAGYRSTDGSVAQIRDEEIAAGLNDIAIYRTFAGRPMRIKTELLEFFFRAHRAGKRVVGYGAPAKGNTLLNYCGIGPELMPFTVDRSPHKQDHLLPGTRIPVRHPDAIIAARPAYVLILPWNLKEEIVEQMHCIRSWGGRFVTAIPEVTVF